MPSKMYYDLLNVTLVDLRREPERQQGFRCTFSFPLNLLCFYLCSYPLLAAGILCAPHSHVYFAFIDSEKFSFWPFPVLSLFLSLPFLFRPCRLFRFFMRTLADDTAISKRYRRVVKKCSTVASITFWWTNVCYHKDGISYCDRPKLMGMEEHLQRLPHHRRSRKVLKGECIKLLGRP